MTEKVRLFIEVKPFTNNGKELTTFKTKKGDLLTKNELTESPLNENNRHTLCSLREFDINPDPLDYIENRRSRGVIVSLDQLEEVGEKLAKKNDQNKSFQERIKLIEDKNEIVELK